MSQPVFSRHPFSDSPSVNAIVTNATFHTLHLLEVVCLALGAVPDSDGKIGVVTTTDRGNLADDDRRARAVVRPSHSIQGLSDGNRGEFLLSHGFTDRVGACKRSDSAASISLIEVPSCRRRSICTTDGMNKSMRHPC